MDCSTLGLPIPHHLSEFAKFMPTELVMPFSHLILCHPLFLLPSILPSIRDFSNESVLSIWWPKYWSFSFSISPSNEYLGLIFLKINWFDLLAVQGTLRSSYLEVAQSCLTLCNPMDISMPGFPVHHQFLELAQTHVHRVSMSIESVMPSNYLILCCPLLLLPSIFSSIRVFSNESVLCIRWPKY